VATNVATLPDISTPSAPTDGVKVFSSDIAGQSTLSTIDSGGIPNPLQSSLAHKQWGGWFPQIAGTTLNFMGSANGAAGVGTYTARTPAATNLATSLHRISVVSGAAGADIATARSTTNGSLMWRGNAAGLGGFYTSFRFVVADAVLVATANMFVGLSNQTIATEVATSTRINLIGVGCDNGDTTLQLYAAGGTAQARVDLGANFPVNTVTTDVYELVLFAAPNGSDVKYRVTRLNTGHTTSGTISVAANLPANTTFMGPHFVRSNGGTAAAVAIDVVGWYYEANY